MPNTQELSNLCWAAAVLDLQQCVPEVLQLARAASQQWDRGVAAEGLQQLHQPHLWLLDAGLPATPGQQGLAGCLTAQQLQECTASWEQALDDATVAKASQLQRSVLSALQQLPASTWQQAPVMEQRTADGAFSIDVAAVTAAGQSLAIEADGPSHFVRPGRVVDGPTQARNRALAARGYRIMCVPWWEWDALEGDKQRQQAYVVELLQRAGVAVDDEPPRQAVRSNRPAPAPGGAAASRGGVPATPPADRVRRVRRRLAEPE